MNEMELLVDEATATGYYINVVYGGYDIFVVLNEPNDPPTPEEVDAIAKVVMEKFLSAKSEQCFRKAIEDLGLNCTLSGVQVFIN